MTCVNVFYVVRNKISVGSVSPRMKKGQGESSSKGTLSAQNLSEKGTFINAFDLQKRNIYGNFSGQDPDM